MRVEKAYHGWGADSCSKHMMFDAGLEKFIDFEKTDFGGGLAMLAQKNQPP